MPLYWFNLSTSESSGILFFIIVHRGVKISWKGLAYYQLIVRYALKLKINMKSFFTKEYFFLNSNHEITSKITSKKTITSKIFTKSWNSNTNLLTQCYQSANLGLMVKPPLREHIYTYIKIRKSRIEIKGLWLVNHQSISWFHKQDL